MSIRRQELHLTVQVVPVHLHPPTNLHVAPVRRATIRGKKALVIAKGKGAVHAYFLGVTIKFSFCYSGIIFTKSFGSIILTNLT